MTLPETPLGRPNESAGAPETIWFVSGGFGKVSQPWLWRQITGFERLAPHLVCWERMNEDDYPIPGIPVHVMDFDRRPMDRRTRWIYRLRNLPSGNFYGTQGAEKKRLEALARETRPAAMLCQFGHFALRLLPVAKKLDIPLVAHFHGMDVSSMVDHDRWYRSSLIRELRSFAEIVVVGSDQERWMLDAGAPPERVHRIPCGAPTEIIRPIRREPETRAVRFLVVGRLVEWKGVEFAIQAFSRVVAEFPDAMLDIAGDGPDRAKLESLVAELGVRNAVTFHGDVPPQRIGELLASAHVLLQHSLDHETGWSEGFGVSVAEAAASGLPVVASQCGGLRDQVVDGETGFLVPQRDVGEMVKAMTRLARDADLRARFGQAGRTRTVEHFDSARQIVRLEALVLHAIGGSGTAAFRR